jgi:transposase-like protein
MSTKSTVNSAKGKRYSEKEKADIIAFVEKVNAEKGRGGQSAASAKFKISQLTISSWLKAATGGSSTKSSSTKGGFGSKLSKLSALAGQIEKAEKELGKLKSQFDALKKSL